MDNDSRITQTVVNLYAYGSDNLLYKRGFVEMNCNTLVKFKYRSKRARFMNLQSFVDWWTERSIRFNFFWLIWRAFSLGSHLNIVWIYVSRAVFSTLMVHHFLRTNFYRISIFQRLETCRFFQELYLHIDKNSGGKFEGMKDGNLGKKIGTLTFTSVLERHHPLQ